MLVDIFDGYAGVSSPADDPVVACPVRVLMVPCFPHFSETAFTANVEPYMDGLVLLAGYVLPAFDSEVFFLIAHGFTS